MTSRRTLSFARLCAFNAGIQLVWGAILGISLQARTIALSPDGDAVARYSVLAAFGALVATVTQLLAGRASDHVRSAGGGRGRFYAVGVGLALPALATFFVVPNFPALAIAFLALEGTFNLAIGPYQAIIPDFVPRSRRGVASAWMSAYQSFGNACGLLVAGLVADTHIVAVVLAVPLFASYAISSRHARALSHRDAAGEIDVTTDRADGYAPRAPNARTSGTNLAALLFSRGAINVGFFALLDYLLFFVRDSLRIAPERVQSTTAFVFLTFTVAAIVGAIVAAKPADRADKRLVVTIAIAIVVLSLGVLAGATSLPVAFASAGVAGGAWGAFVTADWALATAVLPARAMATAMGIWNVATTLPQVIAPLIAGPLVVYASAAHSGFGPRAAIVFAMLAFTIGAGAVWRLPRV